MIKSLSIKNYALIDSLNIRFDKGFTVLTGETGAGKSIILGALSLILGARADAKTVKEGETKCVIEGEFDLSYYDLEDYFKENDLDYDNAHCIIRRELFSTGKSRAFINDSPVPLQQLKALMGNLIDIHSQHHNLLLGDTVFQLRVIDAIAGNNNLISDYKKQYKEYKKTETELKQMKEALDKSLEEADYLRFQFEQLEEANLTEGEQVQMEEEIRILSNAEDIKQSLYAILSILDNSDGGVISLLKDASGRASSLKKIFSIAEDIAERLDSDYIDLKDLVNEIEDAQDSIEFNPERMDIIRERLDLLYNLQQKHRVSSVDELIEIRETLRKKISSIDNSDENIAKQEKLLKDKEEKTLKVGKKLSAKRTEVSKRFASDLMKTIQPLGMPNARFEVELTEKKTFDENGLDNISYLFSANKKNSLMPVVDVASGGEISRLMLVIKSLIASNASLPTIIFDEVDTGVSGEIADKMGDIMKRMSGFMQVVTISHLPQVAAKGDNHFKVYKTDNEHGTSTHIVQLSPDERVDEVARMLSGAVLTEQAKENARVLIAQNKKH